MDITEEIFFKRPIETEEDKHLKEGILQGEIYIYVTFTLKELSSPFYEWGMKLNQKMTEQLAIRV